MNKKVVLIFLGIVFGIFALSAFAVETLLSSTFNKGSMAFLEEALQSRVESKTTKVSLLPFPTVTVKNFVIHNPDSLGFEDAAALRVGKLKMSIDFFALFQKKFIVRSFVLKNCELLLEVNEDGISNFESLIEQSLDSVEVDSSITVNVVTSESDSVYFDTLSMIDTTSSSGGNLLEEDIEWVFLVKKTKVKNIRIRYINHKTNAAYIFDDIDNRFYFLLNGPNKRMETTNTFSLSGVTIKPKNKESEVLDDVKFTLAYDIESDLTGSNIIINDISSSFNELEFSMSGVYDSALVVSSKVEKLPLKKVIAALPEYYTEGIDNSKSKGVITYSLDIKGSIEEPEIDFKVDITDGEIQYRDRPNSLRNIDLDLDVTGKNVNLSNFSLLIGDDPIAMKFELERNDTPEVKGFLRGSVNFDSLSSVMPIPEDITIGGVVKSDLRWKGTYSKESLNDLRLRGDVVFSDFVYAGSETKKLVIADVKRSGADLVISCEQFFSNDSIGEKELLSLSDEELFTILLGE